jgi:hypothetical protein
MKEHSLNAEKMRKNLENQVKELQTRLDQAEANALKGSKRIIQSLEQKVSCYKFTCLSITNFSIFLFKKLIKIKIK